MGGAIASAISRSSKLGKKAEEERSSGREREREESITLGGQNADLTFYTTLNEHE